MNDGWVVHVGIDTTFENVLQEGQRASKGVAPQTDLEMLGFCMLATGKPCEVDVQECGAAARLECFLDCRTKD